MPEWTGKLDEGGENIQINTTPNQAHYHLHHTVLAKIQISKILHKLTSLSPREHSIKAGASSLNSSRGGKLVGTYLRQHGEGEEEEEVESVDSHDCLPRLTTDVGRARGHIL